MKINTNKPYHIFAEHVEQEALDQFESALNCEFATRGALMPDAHTGYSLPIGAVVETKHIIGWIVIVPEPKTHTTTVELCNGKIIDLSYTCRGQPAIVSNRDRPLPVLLCRVDGGVIYRNTCNILHDEVEPITQNK